MRVGTEIQVYFVVTRRLLSRAWNADPVLKHLFDSFVGAGSMTQLIDNSPVFKAMWQKTQAYNRVITGKGLRSLSASQVRFSSHGKPLGRMCLFIESIIVVAVQIVEIRGRTENSGAKAAWFLENIDADKVLLLSMMADGADEVSGLLRLCDKGLDTADLLQHVGDFVSKVDFLFGRQGVFHVLGFTEFTIKQTLSKTICWKVGSELRSMSLHGDALDHIKRMHIHRMQAWQRLAVSVVSAEFPDFDVCNAFAVFSLSDSLQDGGQTPPCMERHCQKLAQVFKLGATVLQQELMYLRTAAARQKGTGVSNGSAWELALSDFSKKHKHLIGAPTCETLVSCLMRYRAYAISTCGLERKFSQQVWANRTQSQHQSCNAASVKSKLLNDYMPGEESQIISAAQAVWISQYGPTRLTKGARFHKGRSQMKAGNSEAAWLRKRRASVATAIASSSMEVCPRTPPRPEDPPVWAESHEKEERYQHMKRRKIQIEAFQRGSLLPDEVDDALPVDAALAEGTHRKNALQKHNKKQRETALSALKLQDAMKHTRRTLFLESCGTDDQRVQITKMQGVRCTERRTEADVFVASDPTQTGLRTAWAARLIGTWVVAPETLLHPRMQGAALKWKSALDTRRRLYWTPGACHAYPKVVTLVETIITRTDTRPWRCLHDEEEYLLEKRKAIAARRSPLVIAIGVEAELQPLCDKLPGRIVELAKHHIFNQAEAMKFLQQFETCRTGAASVQT